MKSCSVDGCGKPLLAKGLCSTHYARLRRLGSTGQPPGRRLIPLANRFWAKVDRSGTCWVWTGSMHHRGYGMIRGDGFKASMLKAHRVAWELDHGPIPDGMVVRHTCDNPPCVRPDHLVLGTQADNVADMVERGRAKKARRDAGSAQAKLTAAQVAEIRARHQPRRVSYTMLAAEYGVHPSTIAVIVRAGLRPAPVCSQQ